MVENPGSFNHTCEVEALRSHVAFAEALFGEVFEMVKTPMSEVDPVKFHEFIERQKGEAVPLEADLKDAKRRISASKAKKTKKVKKESSESDCEGSA